VSSCRSELALDAGLAPFAPIALVGASPSGILLAQKDARSCRYLCSRVRTLTCWHVHLLADPRPQCRDFAGGFTLRFSFLRRLPTSGRMTKRGTFRKSERRNWKPNLLYHLGRLGIKPCGRSRPGVKDRERRLREGLNKPPDGLSFELL